MGTETDRLLAEARKPYADKIMELQDELARTREDLRHAEAQRATARAERDEYQEKLSTLRDRVRNAVERSYPA